MALINSGAQKDIGLDLSQTNVLAVDPDCYASETLCQIMRGFGIRLQCPVGTGKEAKEKFAETKVDLAFIEAVLPDMSGSDLVKWVRKKFKPEN